MGGGNQTSISSTVKSAVSPLCFVSPRNLGRFPERAGDSRSQPVRDGRDHLYTARVTGDMSIRNVIPKFVGERAACRASGPQANWSLFVCRIRGCRLTAPVRSGSGETPTVFEPASYRHEAFSLSSAISPYNIGRDKLAETEKSRQNRFVGYGAVFFKTTGRFLEGTPCVGSNDIFIIEIPPRASPDLLSLDSNRWQTTPLFTLFHTELSYQLYTSFHTAARVS